MRVPPCIRRPPRKAERLAVELPKKPEVYASEPVLGEHHEKRSSEPALGERHERCGSEPVLAEHHAGCSSEPVLGGTT